MKVPKIDFRRAKNSYEAKKCVIRSARGGSGVLHPSVSIFRFFVRCIFKKIVTNRDFSFFGPKMSRIFSPFFPLRSVQMVLRALEKTFDAIFILYKLVGFEEKIFISCDFQRFRFLKSGGGSEPQKNGHF